MLHLSFLNSKIGRNRKKEPAANSLSRPTSGDLQFRIFAVAWAIAMLFHMAHSSVFDIQLNLALLTLAAIYVIFRPSITGFTIMICLQIFDACFRMPFTTNHWIFAAFANISILHVLLFLAIQRRTFSIRQSEFFQRFAPLIRIELIILYFFAAFHKLNAGFFSPDTSCATDLLKAQNIDHIVPLDASLYTLNAYATLMIEASIPILLCFSTTRSAAVLIGLFFHCVLSYSTYNAFYDFSAVMFAAYFLFIHPAFSQMLYDIAAQLKRIKKSFTQTFSPGKLSLIIFMCIFSLASIYILNQRLNTYQAVHLYFFWTIYSLIFTGCFIVYLFRRREEERLPSAFFGVDHWSFIAIPFIVFLNGALPYLGLKTENSYAMFSNLRTEGGKTNHFIVPASAQLFSYQRNVVEIISSTDPALQKLAEQKKALVLFEFRRFVNERKPDKVEYVLNGERMSFSKSTPGSFKALGDNHYVLKKLMKFRPFALQEPQPCAH